MFHEVQTISDLSTALEKTFHLERNTEQHDQLYIACLKYILKKINARGFKANLKEILGTTDDQFRLNLVESIYILRNLKAYVIRLSTGEQVRGKQFEIAAKDILTCNRDAVGDFIDSLHFEQKVIDRVTNLAQLDRRLQSLIPELQTFCKNYVMRKLLFVLRSCNYELHDLTGEMICKAIISYYHTSTECRSRLHTLNFLRNSCKNHGTNMISFFTTKKRSRLVKVGENQFSLTIVSENQMKPNQQGEDQDPNYENLSITEDRSNDVLLQLSVQKVITDLNQPDVKNGAKKIEFIKLLMGHYDKKFSEFLHSKGIPMSNDEYIDKVKPERYSELVAEYLKFDRVGYYRLMRQLRKKLA